MAARRTTRPGRTAKLSISIDRAALAILRSRARRLYAGNLSAVIADSVRLIEEEEGRLALVAWLGSAADATEAERQAIRSEWSGPPPRRRRRQVA
jgi:hypothetical protein